MDAISRIGAGVLGHEQSHSKIRLATVCSIVPLPVPKTLDGKLVPKVLLSGDHDKSGSAFTTVPVR